MSRNYECMIVFNAEVTQEEKDKNLSKMKEILALHEGEVEKVEEWGKRALSTPINKKTDGDYSLVLFKGNPEVVGELNSMLRINERILRFLLLSRVTPKPPKVKKHQPKQAVNEQA